MEENDYLFPDGLCLELLEEARQIAQEHKNEYIHPEHLILALFNNREIFKEIEENFTDGLDGWRIALTEHIDQNIGEKNLFQQAEEHSEEETSLQFSHQMQEALETAGHNAYFAHLRTIDVPQLFNAIYQLPDSFAQICIDNCFNTNYGNVLSALISQCANLQNENENRSVAETTDSDEYLDEEEKALNDELLNYVDSLWGEKKEEGHPSQSKTKKSLICLNEVTSKKNPLIGREEELERTFQILCRKDKNNLIYIGEPGVGKTAIVYGLAERINKGDVPDKLKNCKIYELKISDLLAGAQYRGDFEKRLKDAMEECLQEKGSIVYIDEIHNIVNAGNSGNSSLDASNMLKPYLENGDLRFIGSTTYEDFNKYISNDKALIRRFQQIDVKEPSIEEATQIIKRLIGKYESFHGVKFKTDAIEYAVEASAKLILNRHLPDKVIDLIDEAGAYAATHPNENGKKTTITKTLINTILQKICKINAQAIKEDDGNANSLKEVEKNLYGNIYGQDKAIEQLMENIQLAKAGLKEENKPIASLLFVGPTGVGKTELCKTLSDSLNIPLVRFDMSEYAEKHTVAKLIGSPAGYVGYDDGGLLTSAILNTPNCVLLLDEIEKAHPDIFNILLQVMDYAQLTDNKGGKANFQHVILIMTSNAGAQYAHLSNIGFGKKSSSGNAMMTEVKKVFKPEFINRLDDIVIFNDMDEKMASLVLDKNIRNLEKKLSQQKVTLTISEEAKKHLLAKGYSKEYGAREMERVVRFHLTKLLSKEILFGKLKKGGNAIITLEEGKLVINKG